MHKKIVSLAVLMFALSTNIALADTNTQTNPTTSSNPPATSAATTVPILVSQIHSAKQTLNDTIKLNYSINARTKTKITGIGKKKKILKTTIYSLDSKGAALAILDPGSGTISVVKGIQIGQKFTFKDPDYTIEQHGFNGVNTRFTVSKPAGAEVLALKYLISNPDSANSKDAIVNGLAEAVYVPYSPDLATAEVSQYGEDYMNSVIKNVAAQLKDVPSRSQPGLSIVNAIQPTIVKSLVYAEHMDTSAFINNPDTQQLIDQLNMLFAGNENDTFKYSVSSANARGISQFIPSTYASLVQRHPEANLMPDFVAGMSDHVNSIKAQYLLLDDYIAAVKIKIGYLYNPAYAYDYGAASYNGGVSRVSNAVVNFSQNWDSPQASTASLKDETIHYLEKMRKLIQIFNGESVNLQS